MQGTVKFKLTSRHLVRVPRFVLRRVVAAEAKQMTSTIAFMSPNHHAVRNFVVTEIATTGAGVSPERIADKCGLAPERVAVILDELERKMVFVWRDEGRDVSWAYPVTSEATPHRIEYVDAKPTYGA